MPSYYPPVGFHFKVEVLGLPPNDNDVRFTEVGGLSVELGTEEVAEGGENRFVQKYPTRAKYPELVLKRGLLLKLRGDEVGPGVHRRPRRSSRRTWTSSCSTRSTSRC